MKLLEEQSAKYLAANIKLEAKVKEGEKLKATGDALKKGKAEAERMRAEADAR